MKLGHIVKYHDVFIKFDNGPYRTMLSGNGPLFMKIHRLKRCPLSKSNSFDQKFIKLCHIVKYHDVFHQISLWSISHHAFMSYGPFL